MSTLEGLENCLANLEKLVENMEAHYEQTMEHIREHEEKQK